MSAHALKKHTHFKQNSTEKEDSVLQFSFLNNRNCLPDLRLKIVKGFGQRFTQRKKTKKTKAVDYFVYIYRALRSQCWMIPVVNETPITTPNTNISLMLRLSLINC